MQVWRTTSERGSCSAFELLLLACLSACTKSDRPIIVVEVRDQSEHRLTFDKPKVEQYAVTTIDRVPGYGFRQAKAEENGWQYVFVIDLLAERIADGSTDGTTKHRAVEGVLELKEVGGDGYFETKVLETSDEPASAPLEPLIQRAIDKAAGQLTIAMKLTHGTDEELVALLDSPEPNTRGQAITLAGRRKIQKAVPKLIALVKDEKATDDQVLKAVGALVQIGDQEASGAIIDAGKHRSSEYQLQLLFALSKLGGLEAEAYLFTVQNGHPDPVVRQTAHDALEELEVRREAKKKVESPP